MTGDGKPAAGKPGPALSAEGKRANVRLRQAVMVVLAALCLTPWAAPWSALTAGVAVALLGLSAFEKISKPVARYLIQVSVVLLGLRLPFDKLLDTGAGGLAFAAGTILGALALGWLLGRALRIDGKVAALVSSGTAICGGSAIAAVGSAIAATGAQMAVAMGTVFLLNGAALYLFPLIGHALNLSETQFGVWAGVAIHDVSSVVGASSSYHVTDPHSAVAAETATVVKLSRVIWIVPIAAGAAWIWRGLGRAGAKPKSPVPLFIIGFILASAARTFIDPVTRAADANADAIKYVASAGMTLALFLIGAGLSKKAIASVGWRPLAMGVILWAALAGASLGVVMGTVD
jgi:uncharacterized integral membrane protein (TIGR00698 family)